MRYQGPFGAPRLTSVGPLVNRRITVSQKLSAGRADSVVRDIADEHDIPSNDISEEEFDLIVREAAQELYPEDDSVSESKRDRFKRCMRNSWVSQWVSGIEDSDEVDIEFQDDLDRVSMMLRGCIGMNEANTADDEAIIPEEFKQ